jgi:hypothetical protein
VSHIFLSYSRRDDAYVGNLVTTLRDKGFDVWIDDHRLRGSEDWWKVIVSAVLSCSAFVVVLTPHSDESRWVQREITIADREGKPMFPLLLEGSINTRNWSIFVRTQYVDVRGGRLPPDEFYEMLAQYSLRRSRRGDIVVSTRDFPAVSLEDENFQLAVNKSLKEDGTSFKKRFNYILPVGLVLVTLIGIMLTRSHLPNTNATHEIPLLETSTATVNSLTFTQLAIPSATPLIANIETFNRWREEHGYAPLLENNLLNQLAHQHQTELANRPLSDQGNRYRSYDGLDIQQLAEAVGYHGQVRPVVEVSEGEVTLDDVLLHLESFGGADVHRRYNEIGFAAERRAATGILYFVLLLGDGN